MDGKDHVSFLDRNRILEMGKAIWKEMPDMSDGEILRHIERFYITKMQAYLDGHAKPIEIRTVLMQRISIFFEDLAAELRANPSRFTFRGVPEVDRDSDVKLIKTNNVATPSGFTDEALRPHPSAKHSPDTTENHFSLEPESMGNQNSSQPKGESSATPMEMPEDKLLIDAALEIDEHEVGPTASATTVDLNEEKDKSKDRPFVSKRAEEALADDSLSRSVDTPAEDDGAPARSYINPVADRVLEMSEMQQNMLYEIVTQMQRERLELGPEVSDYEVIAKAHAGYTAVDEAEATALARAAKTQKASALKISRREGQRAVTSPGLPTAQMGGPSLTQGDIDSLFRRCDESGGSSSAVKEYVLSKAADFKDLYVDPDPFTSDNLESTTGAGTTDISSQQQQQKRKNKTTSASSADGADKSLEEIEAQIKSMKFFHSRMTAMRRDFAKDIAELEEELAELKAHRAKAPGDLVPDSVDGTEGGIHVDPKDLGDGVEHGAQDNQEEASSSGTKKKKKSRAEQRRIAREKAKGKGKATE